MNFISSDWIFETLFDNTKFVGTFIIRLLKINMFPADFYHFEMLFQNYVSGDYDIKYPIRLYGL